MILFILLKDNNIPKYCILTNLILKVRNVIRKGNVFVRSYFRRDQGFICSE